MNVERCRLPPFKHQREDVDWLVTQPWALIASEMRTGKTKIVIDAAQVLFEQRLIDRVIVVAPAPVRDVWYDPKLGELAKHLWLDTSAKIIEWCSARTRIWNHGPSAKRYVEWWITNYEYLRSGNNLDEFLEMADAKTLLVLDESAYVKNWRAAQTEACFKLRRCCGRVWLLNGTPIFHSPEDLFSQGNMLHPSILACRYITHYKARYAVEAPILAYGGKPLTDAYGRAVKKVDHWTNLDDLQRRFAPVTVRRLQRDCLDLPPKLDPVTITATLTTKTWRQYREMKDDMITWLESGVATSSTAAIKVMRLAQITSGFVGGVETVSLDDETPTNGSTHNVGREKLDACIWFLGQRLEAEPDAKTVFFCRFRAEALRLVDALQTAHPEVITRAIIGDQSPAERAEATALMKPETAPKEPAAVVCTFKTASYGLDFSAASAIVTVSPQHSPGLHAQSMERAVGPKMRGPLAYFDVVAVGPRGQRTIDHHIIDARRRGEDVASWTSSAWITALRDE